MYSIHIAICRPSDHSVHGEAPGQDSTPGRADLVAVTLTTRLICSFPIVDNNFCNDLFTVAYFAGILHGGQSGIKLVFILIFLMILHFIKFFSLCNDEFLFLNTFYDFLVLIALVLLNLISWVFRDICICFFSYNQHKFNIFNIQVEYKIDQICFCLKGKFHHPTSYKLYCT